MCVGVDKIIVKPSQYLLNLFIYVCKLLEDEQFFAENFFACWNALVL